MREGFEPVLQTTCRDRNRIALSADLLGAAAQGVRNLLVLHGDDPKTGDMPEAKPVYDLDSRAVMSLARDMRDQGRLPSGREIISPPHFFIGCADAPIDPPDNWEPKGLEAKIAAGAQFAQTQFCFDAALAERYFARIEALGITKRLKIIAGIGPLLSAKQARFMNEKLFGVSIPASDHRPARSGKRSQGRGAPDLRRTDRTPARHEGRERRPHHGAVAIAGSDRRDDEAGGMEVVSKTVMPAKAGIP